MEESRSGLITKLLGFYTGNNRGTIAGGEGGRKDRLPNPTATFAERNTSFGIRRRWLRGNPPLCRGLGVTLHLGSLNSDSPRSGVDSHLTRARLEGAIMRTRATTKPTTSSSSSSSSSPRQRVFVGCARKNSTFQLRATLKGQHRPRIPLRVSPILFSITNIYIYS